MSAWDIHPRAQQELEAIVEYYLAIDAELALSFDEHYTRYRQEIVANPRRFSVRRPPVRRVNLTPRFGAYYIAYMIWHHKPVILAVAHGARKPGYWQKRIMESKKMF
jgi:plasmid stabilization system protein ParE